LKIARRFNAGLKKVYDPVPSGTVEIVPDPTKE